MRSPGAAAQQSVPVVGFLFIANPERSIWWLDAWRKSMADSGFVEGRNVAFDFRWGEGDVTRLPGFAAGLVARPVAAIVTTTVQAVLAAKQATTTIPIVFTGVSDPVGKGLVKSLTRPGGNITGIGRFNVGALESKMLQLLHEAVPAVASIGYLVAEQDIVARRGTIDAMAAAGKTLGIELVLLTVSRPGEIDPAFATAKQRNIGAVLIQSPSGLLYAEQKRILQAAARYKLPVGSGNVDFAEGGGLIQYSMLPAEAPYLAGTYVARILKGENPAVLPVLQTTQTSLSLNLKAAQALGLVLPSTLLARADEVIE